MDFKAVVRTFTLTFSRLEDIRSFKQSSNIVWLKILRDHVGYFVENWFGEGENKEISSWLV